MIQCSKLNECGHKEDCPGQDGCEDYTPEIPDNTKIKITQKPDISQETQTVLPGPPVETLIDKYMKILDKWIDSPEVFKRATAYSLIASTLGRQYGIYLPRKPRLFFRPNTWFILSCIPARGRRSELLGYWDVAYKNTLTKFYTHKGMQDIGKKIKCSKFSGGSTAGVADHIEESVKQHTLNDFVIFDGEFGSVLNSMKAGEKGKEQKEPKEKKIPVHTVTAHDGGEVSYQIIGEIRKLQSGLPSKELVLQRMQFIGKHPKEEVRLAYYWVDPSGKSSKRVFGRFITSCPTQDFVELYESACTEGWFTPVATVPARKIKVTATTEG